MPVPDGQQFINLYRGLQGVSPHRVRNKDIGDIWTSSPVVAHKYATGDVDDGATHNFGTVIHAKVHVSAIAEDDTGDHLREYRLHPGSEVEISDKRFAKQNESHKTWEEPLDWKNKFPIKGTI